MHFFFVPPIKIYFTYSGNYKLLFYMYLYFLAWFVLRPLSTGQDLNRHPPVLVNDLEILF